jgi:hypothetical protein
MAVTAVKRGDSELKVARAADWEGKAEDGKRPGRDRV